MISEKIICPGETPLDLKIKWPAPAQEKMVRKRLSCEKCISKITCPGEPPRIFLLKITCPGEEGPQRPSCEKFISENHLSRRNTPRFENKMTCPGQGCPQMTELSCEKIQYLQHLSAHPVREAPPHPPTHFKKPGAVAVLTASRVRNGYFDSKLR